MNGIKEKMDDHTRDFLMREDRVVEKVREKTRNTCYVVLKTEKGKKMLKAEARRLQTLRKKRIKRLRSVEDHKTEKRKMMKVMHTFEVPDRSRPVFFFLKNISLTII